MRVSSQGRMISGCHRFLPSTFRLSTLGLLLTFNFSLLIFSCGLDVEDPTPPSPPVWVQKSLPEEWPERGIDAHESQGIFLEWYVPEERFIQEFNLFRQEGSDTSGYGLHEVIAAENFGNEVFTYIDKDAHFDNPNAYYLVALDESAVMSSPSDTVFYILTQSIHASTMTPQNGDILQANRTFNWASSIGMQFQSFVFSIINVENILIYRRVLQPRSYTGNNHSFILPGYIELTTGSRYAWRVDVHMDVESDVESGGGESPWVYFYAFEQ